MIMKAILLTCLFSCALLTVSAQEQQRLMQYYLHPQAFNPSMAGIEDYWNLNAGWRYGGVNNLYTQEQFFLGVNGVFRLPDIRMNSLRISKPEAYQEESIESYRKRMRRHGVGAFLSNRTVGNQRVTSGLFSYAYHLPLSRTLTLSAGAGVSTTFMRLKGDFSVVDPSDEVYQALTSGALNEGHHDVNVGVTLYHAKFYLGYSAGQVKVADTDNSPVDADAVRYTQHNLMAGYQLPLNRNLSLQPGIMFRYNSLDELQIQGNVKLQYREMLRLGVSYRDNALAGTFGLVLNNRYTLNYAYEAYTADALAERNLSTHEVTLGIRLLRDNSPRAYFW